jgi:CRISPR-associated protein Cas2
MERHRYLVAYDISEPRRLQRVYQEMLGWGTRLQNSVYLCDLTRGELVRLRRRLLDLIDRQEDSVAILDLGDPESRYAATIDTLGKKPPLPDNGPAIY